MNFYILSKAEKQWERDRKNPEGKSDQSYTNLGAVKTLKTTEPKNKKNLFNSSFLSVSGEHKILMTKNKDEIFFLSITLDKDDWKQEIQKAIGEY